LADAKQCVDGCDVAVWPGRRMITRLSKKVDAMAKTHLLLTDGPGQAASFRDLLTNELRPFDDGSGKRIVLDGPPVRTPIRDRCAVGHGPSTSLPPTQASTGLWRPEGLGPCALGAESKPQGLVWDWNEHDGPPNELPTKEGFGTKLLKRLLTDQTGAEVRLEFERDGLHVFMSVPLGSGAHN
jgi:two-component sensor histidine kinase